MHQVVVVNRYHLKPLAPGDPVRVVVMRGQSPVGNPYRMADRSGTERRKVVAAFRTWPWAKLNEPRSPARREMERLLAIARREPLELVCCCAPKPCHGDVIRSALLWMDAGNER